MQLYDSPQEPSQLLRLTLPLVGDKPEFYKCTRSAFEHPGYSSRPSSIWRERRTSSHFAQYIQLSVKARGGDQNSLVSDREKVVFAVRELRQYSQTIDGHGTFKICIQNIRINEITLQRLSREFNLPIIMCTFSGSSPANHFLLRPIPSRSTKILRVTSNPETTCRKKLTGFHL